MARTQIRFGTAGNSDSFYAQGHKATVDAPRWLAAQGLDAFEYSAGRGVMLGEKTGRAIGREAAAHGIALSIHAPYYINCGSPDIVKREKSIDYLLTAARACDWMGGDRVVFHIGAPGTDRPEANRLSKQVVNTALTRMDDMGLGHIALCPETMGRPSQLGSLDEVLALCKTDERLVPTLDFGHLHTVGLGALNSTEDFRRVLERMMQVLGEARARAFHVHFSHIEFTAKGEKRHMTFAEEGYGPDFALLAPLLLEYRMTPTIICESRGTQAEDALAMKARLIDRA